MSAINRAIRDAKSSMPEVCIRKRDVRTIAEHVRMTAPLAFQMPIDSIVDLICEGQIKLLGKPMMVSDQ